MSVPQRVPALGGLLGAAQDTVGHLAVKTGGARVATSSAVMRPSARFIAGLFVIIAGVTAASTAPQRLAAALDTKALAGQVRTEFQHA